jgi:hypothetical protein
MDDGGAIRPVRELPCGLLVTGTAPGWPAKSVDHEEEADRV